MAYKVISNGGEYYADAIETYAVIDDILRPIEALDADGFKALVIVRVSPSEEYYDETLYVLPDHTLDGYDVPVGTYEETDEPIPSIEPEEEEDYGEYEQY